MNSHHPVLASALLVALVAGCQSGGKPAGPLAAKPSPAADLGPLSGKVVARYGNRSLTTDDVAEELLRIPERARIRLTSDSRRAMVENRVLSDLVVDDARVRGVDDDPEIARQVDDLRKRRVFQKVMRGLQEIPVIDDETVRKFYVEHPERFSAATIKARHVLSKSEEEARAIRDLVRADPSRFPEIAKEKSTDLASARQGGDLGWFGRGRMVPEFEEVAFALPPGQVSDPVKTAYGWHVIVVEEFKQGEPEPLDQVKEQIRMLLRNQAVQSRVAAYYAGLKEGARYSLDDGLIEQVASTVGSVDASPVEMGPHGGAPSAH